MVHVVFVVLSNNTEGGFRRIKNSSGIEMAVAVSGMLPQLAGLSKIEMASKDEIKWVGWQACRRLLQCLTSERRQRSMLRGIPEFLANERRRQARPSCWPRPLAAGMCQGIALPVIGRPRGSVGFAEAQRISPRFGPGNAPSSANNARI